MQEEVMSLGFFNAQKDFIVTIFWFEKQRFIEIFHFILNNLSQIPIDEMHKTSLN